MQSSTTNPSANTSTRSDGLTRARQLKSSAQAMLSDLDSMLCDIESALQASPDPLKERELLEALNEIDRLSKSLAIERRLCQLTDKQLEVFDAWLDDTSAVVASLGGNRSGKTFGLAAAIAYDIRELAPPNSTFLCIARESSQSAANQQKELWNLLPQDMLSKPWTGEQHGFGSERPMTVFDPKGRNVSIIFMTQSQYDNDWRSFEAKTIYRIWIDESVSAGAFAAAGMRVATTKNAKVALSTIRDEAWIDDLVAESQVDPSYFVREFTPDDNPVMDAAKIERQKKFARFGGDDMYAMRIEGKALVAGSRVYQEFERQRHVIAHRDFKERTQGDVCWYAGLDSGMDHPTVWLLAALSRDGKVYVYDEYTSRNTTPESDVKAILAKLGNRQLVWPTVADPAMWQNRKLGMEALQYNKAGLPLMPAHRTSRFGEDFGVNLIKDMLRNDELFVCDSCKLLIANFHKWRYKRDREGNILENDKYVDKDNDALDALRYLLTKNPSYVIKRKAIAQNYDA